MNPSLQPKSKIPKSSSSPLLKVYHQIKQFFGPDPWAFFKKPVGQEEELISKRKFEQVEEEGSKKEKKKKKKDESSDKKVGENRELEQQLDCKEGDEDKIVVTGKDAQDAKYAPVKSFADSKLPDDVLKCCKDFKTPSPIQARAWPFLLDGRDFICIAKTGSGKTLAYGIPAVMHVLSKRKGGSKKKVNPLCLVLAPTRELADQVELS